MRTHGVSTKPITLISGKSPFCETFFDNVRVPKTGLVGVLNQGWDVAKYLLTHERQMLGMVDSALARIREGTYGECISCGNEINPKRLEAVPWTRHCIECQEKLEQGLLEESQK